MPREIRMQSGGNTLCSLVGVEMLIFMVGASLELMKK